MNFNFKNLLCLIWFPLLVCCVCIGQSRKKSDIPAVYSNISKDKNGYFVLNNDQKIYEFPARGKYRLSQLKGNPKGTADGLTFDFENADFAGILYYGFIPYGDGQHPYPVYFKTSSPISAGKASINILALEGKYDMIGWQKKKKGTIGYRVISQDGGLLYDGIITFKGSGPFVVDLTIVEGPFINLVDQQGATISFRTNRETVAKVNVDGRSFVTPEASLNHEIKVSGLSPNTRYDYLVEYGDNKQQYSFKTAPKPGSRDSFSFSYASDSRNGNGGGERNLYGANFYIMKKIMALSNQNNVAFMQFSGDLINGYLSDKQEMNLQYANWKRAVEPFWHHFPIYISMGNHEALVREFKDTAQTTFISVDRFPFDTESAEAIFSQNFVNPENGPISEDGASYDPDNTEMDFPSYRENVFYYSYDNVAVVVLNSNYFYSPSGEHHKLTGGGLHAYIMDQQLLWFKETLSKLEKDDNIDHVFVTQHTPYFPNGGHVTDDMWYNGDNSFRSYVAGKPLQYGIIERRDQLLDLVVNQSSKVVAILTGDEHNYARTKIGPDTNIYPNNYEHSRIKLRRTVYQINNGAAGAPYYAQEITPWSPFVSGFTTQNALVVFHIEGKSIDMEVINPDTLEKFDQLKLR